MQFLCISASNVRHAGPQSTSLRVCELIGQILSEQVHEQLQTGILTLVDLNLQPCIGCGSCYTNRRCIHDPAFNNAYERMCRSDGIFIVSAHYAPIPSKLSMLLEKTEQLAFLPRFHDETKRTLLKDKPIGIIAHGGGTAENSDAYRQPVIDSIANALAWPVDANVVSPSGLLDKGVTFGPSKIEQMPDSIFPIQCYDWADVRVRITPIILAVLAACAERGASAST